MNRGDIWTVDLGGKAGKRPVLIITRQNVLAFLNKVSIAEITTKGKGYPTEVFVGQKANLPKSQSLHNGSRIYRSSSNTEAKKRFRRKKAGNIYACLSQTISGFFTICDSSAERPF